MLKTVLYLRIDQKGGRVCGFPPGGCGGKKVKGWVCERCWEEGYESYLHYLLSVMAWGKDGPIPSSPRFFILKGRGGKDNGKLCKVMGGGGGGKVGVCNRLNVTTAGYLPKEGRRNQFHN